MIKPNKTLRLLDEVILPISNLERTNKSKSTSGTNVTPEAATEIKTMKYSESRITELRLLQENIQQNGLPSLNPSMSGVPSNLPSPKPYHAPIDLLTAAKFAILSKSGITTTGATSVTGDIGTGPIAATALTGFALITDRTNTYSTSTLVTGNIYAADYAFPTHDMIAVAVLDMQAAYTDAANRPNPNYLNLSAGNLDGETLQPGLYKWVSNVVLTNGLTFDGTPTDIWILQITGTFNTASGAIITLTGGAQANNIFWQITGATTLGTASHVEGIFLCKTNMAFQTKSSLNGCALAQTAVTLDSTTIVGGSVTNNDSNKPSKAPSHPSTLPSNKPSNDPSVSSVPSTLSSSNPSVSGVPSNVPSSHPSVSVAPIGVPSLNPSMSGVPSNLPSPKPYHAPIDLLTAAKFAILSKSGITTTGATSVTGDIGTGPIAATALTGFALITDRTNTYSTSTLVTGNIYAADYAFPTHDMIAVAVLDMQAAYTDAANRPNPNYLNLSAGNLDGETLQPGLYKWVSNVVLTNGLTFDGTPTDIWILQITGTFNTASGAIITLTGGAQANNIFWQITGATTLGTASHVEGIFLCKTNMAFQTKSSLNGCALAQTAVTLDSTTIVGGSVTNNDSNKPSKTRVRLISDRFLKVPDSLSSASFEETGRLSLNMKLKEYYDDASSAFKNSPIHFLVFGVIVFTLSLV